jgi:hypothetical protein
MTAENGCELVRIHAHSLRKSLQWTGAWLTNPRQCVTRQATATNFSRVRV